MEYALIVNARDCVGCSACEVACKQEHNLPVGPWWIRVFPEAPQELNGKLQQRYVVSHCLHCSSPLCMEACPVDAITKREDGIVLVQPELCTGCGDCIEACPLGVMQFDEEESIAHKCDLCVERVDRGMKPACVVACPGHCIFFGGLRDVVVRVEDTGLLLRYKDYGDSH